MSTLHTVPRINVTIRISKAAKDRIGSENVGCFLCVLKGVMAALEVDEADVKLDHMNVKITLKWWSE